MKHITKVALSVFGLAILASSIITGSIAFCLEKPTPEQIQQYKADGTWEQRLANARAFGNDRVDPILIERLKYNIKRQLLQSEGKSAQTIDKTLAPPPARQGMPTKGSPKVLILMIAFADAPPIAADTQPAVVSKIFGSGGSGSVYPYESLTNFYQRASYNQLTLQGDVLGWYTTPYNRSSVAQTDSGRETLIKEALNYYDSQGTDFSQYDNDGDGAIDYIAVVWAGTPGNWGDFWWGYQTSFSDPSYTLDGKKLTNYSWQWESRTYPTGSFDPLVVIHETGHALGLPDYYDYDPSVGPNGGVGRLDMMDGNWGDHNCFSKSLLEWITPTVVSSGSGSTTLHSSGTSTDAMLIMPGATGTNLFDEFFMVQSRFREANDSTYPADGLLIWHVDSQLNGADFRYDNSFTAHKLLRLMEADGLEEIEQNIRANAGDYYVAGKTFGHNTFPNSSRYDGTATGIVVNGITAGTLQNTFNATLLPAPTVSITQPAQSQIVNGTISIQASATDSGTVTQVQFFVDGVSIGTDLTAPYEISWNASAAGIGAHTLRADATNNIGVTNRSTSITVFTVLSLTKALVIDLASANGSGPAIASALAANNVIPVIASSITAIDPAVYPAAFVCLGYYYDNHVLTSTESAYLTDYLNAGGSLYIEGGDTWYYDPKLPIHSAMGIQGLADNGGTIAAISGLAGTFTTGISFAFQGTQSWVDSIEIASGVTNATRIWQSVSPAYYTGIARNAGTYKSIGTSFEIGNIPLSLRTIVMARYLKFMGINAPASPPDFDGDGKTDVTVYRPSSGTWYSLPSGSPAYYSAVHWGMSGDVPVAADYDADGISDIAIWRPSSGMWYVLPSTMPGYYVYIAWGAAQDIPVPGDYNGDGIADFVVWRPSTGTWYMLLSSGTSYLFTSKPWGMQGDIPVPGDYDGDGKTDIAIWRPSSGVWFVIPSTAPTSYTSTQWGINGDIPAPGDYDGDGKIDPTVYRPSSGTWFSLPSASSGYTSSPWGISEDTPVPGDYDGDGKIDIAVWRKSSATWFIRPSGSPAEYIAKKWGLTDDKVVSSNIGVRLSIP